MLITKKRVINIDFTEKYVESKQIRIGVPADMENLKKAGFDVANGETSIVPSPIFGKNCSRNAVGELIVDKNLPKEIRHINTIEWSWTLYDGTERTEWCDINKPCYCAKFIPPACVEIKLVNYGENQFLVSILDVDNFNESKKRIKIALNMFLEIFGFCCIYNADFKFDAMDIKRCQWEFLPPGDKIWVSEKHRKDRQNGRKIRNDFYQHRIDTVESYSPNAKYIGTHGFTGYHAFIFENYCIFESGNYGDATYIVESKNWEIFSQMTKQQLFALDKVIYRLVHHSSWDSQIKKLLNSLNISNAG